MYTSIFKEYTDKSDFAKSFSKYFSSEADSLIENITPVELKVFEQQYSCELAGVPIYRGNDLIRLLDCYVLLSKIATKCKCDYRLSDVEVYMKYGSQDWNLAHKVDMSTFEPYLQYKKLLFNPYYRTTFADSNAWIRNPELRNYLILKDEEESVNL